MTNINVLYRLSDNGYVKPKFDNATKIHCLYKAINHFTFANIHLFVDTTNLLETTKNFVDERSKYNFAHLEYYEGGSSAASWRKVFNYALSGKFNDADVIYFLEDDYLHVGPEVADAIIEGLTIADYVSLYDHMDKYIPASQGGNPFIDEDGGEVTKVFRTQNHHWKLTNSTTMTFATTVGQMKVDQEIWTHFTQGTHPNDFQCFLALRDAGRSLITPIPGMSTHCEPRWASPGINWLKM